MQFTFRSLATFTAALCFVLAIVWGFFPDVLLSIWGIEYSGATGLVSRRSAVLFLAFSVVFYRARRAPPSSTRRAVSTGMVVACFGLAALGLGEWLNGHAGPGILLAVIVEIALGLGFIQTKRIAIELAETTG
ncbi:hypothetical protein ACN1C3_06030 [Pseudomonas sp. H11T01]|uniref:hypothetical protein n=1 Tax=Pseudomonas sp. H11T01 TaxID=3402749 RepID=UPI003AD7160E